MSWTYACPQCDAILNPNERVILMGSQGESRMLISFHPQPGNYEFHAPPGSNVKEGEKWDFFCPVCHGDLVAQSDENLCAIELVDGAEHKQILFSRISGEHATFLVSQNKVESTLGSHANRYAQAAAFMKYLKY